ncbi:hypothetical protein LZ32DRAFT_376099 [Colletotrichum eremochloae]|nr:hypothetical protein LZ32DRAFT_376099 [Colletotrichum eremochloae]
MCGCTLRIQTSSMDARHQSINCAGRQSSAPYSVRPHPASAGWVASRLLLAVTSANQESPLAHGASSIWFLPSVASRAVGRPLD